MAEQKFQEMLSAGIAPSIVTFTSLSKPYVRAGDWIRMERMMQELEEYRVPVNEFFLCNILSAYANAKPHPEAQRADAAFRRAVANGLSVDDYVLNALARA